MRKVVLGSKQTAPYPSAKFLQIPRDGAYQDTAFNVMDLKLHPWNDHYAYTTSNMVTSQNLLMPVCTECSNKSVWVLNDTGALEKVSDTIIASPTNTVQVTFIAPRNDGSKLYWITQCLCPNGRGNIVHDKEVLEFVSKENIPDSTVEVYAVKPVCVFNVKDLQTGTERQVRHTNRLFKTAPEWDKIIALLDKTFIGNSEYVAQENQSLEDAINEKITSQEMLQWMEYNGLEVYLNKIYSEKTEEKGYSTDNSMSIEATNAVAVTSYSVQDCPCVVSSNILLMDGDEMPEEPTGTSDENFYFSFNEVLYYKTWKRSLSILTQRRRDYPFIHTSTDFCQYLQFTELGRSESNTIRWERPASPTGYAHKDKLSKVILFETPIDISVSVGHDYLMTGRTTKLFAYCPERDVFIGQNNLTVYPWDVQWIEEPYVYVKPEEPTIFPSFPFYAVCANNIQDTGGTNKVPLYDGRIILIDGQTNENTFHISKVITLREDGKSAYEESETFSTKDVDMTIDKTSEIWVMTEFYETPKDVMEVSAYKPEFQHDMNARPVTKTVGYCEKEGVYVALNDVWWRIISDVIFV